MFVLFSIFSCFEKLRKVCTKRKRRRHKTSMNLREGNKSWNLHSNFLCFPPKPRRGLIYVENYRDSFYRNLQLHHCPSTSSTQQKVFMNVFETIPVTSLVKSPSLFGSLSIRCLNVFAFNASTSTGNKNFWYINERKYYFYMKEYEK